MSFASIARRTYYQQSSIAVAVILMMASYGWGNGQIWKAQTLVIKRIMPLPLKPVPRPPTPGEYKRGLREFQEGGPAMIVIHRERIYFVDDRDGVLLESDFKGKIYRRLILYRRASNILSGPLAVGGKILWVEIDHQVFGVNLESWRIVSVRKWREPQKGFKLTGMYAMSDNQLFFTGYKRGNSQKGYVIRVDDERQEIRLESDWIPLLVNRDRQIYWVKKYRGKYGMIKQLEVGRSLFQGSIKSFAIIEAQKFGNASIDWIEAFGSSGKKIMMGLLLSVPVKGEPGSYQSVYVLVALDNKGNFQLIGRVPPFPKPIRSIYLPKFWIWEGKIYSILRQDYEELSKFWLIRVEVN